MFQKLKQFKDMRDQAKEIQSKLSAEQVEGSAGFGKVKIVLNGAQTALSVAMDDSLFSLNEKKRTEQMVCDAINDAIKKGHKLMAEKMKGMGDLKIPGLN